MFSRLPDLAIVLVALASLAGVGHAAAAERTIHALANANYIYIATVRKDGTQSKAVPVWFITTPENHILINTNTKSWKARRIRRGSPVLVWIGARTGPAFIGKAEFVEDKAVQDQMIKQIPKKYFLARIGLFGPKRAKFDVGQIGTMRISPERDLPEGFQSQPGAPAPALEEKPKSR
jgi:PPOX class probable F420-dependent enzyme